MSVKNVQKNPNKMKKFGLKWPKSGLSISCDHKSPKKPNNFKPTATKFAHLLGMQQILAATHDRHRVYHLQTVAS